MADFLHRDVARARALCFDLFHTLVDVNEASPGSKNTWELLGVSKDEWNRELLENSPWRQTGAVRDPVKIIGRLAKSINPNISDELIRYVAEYRYQRFDRAIMHPPKRSIHTLQELKRRGKKLALVSNADVAEVRAWNKSPLAPLFDCVVFSCDVGCMKPDPRIFFEALRRIDEKPQDCLFVGDGGADELRAARELGFATVMVTGYLSLDAEKLEARKKHAMHVIRFVDELI
ncbi:MAG: HAD family hydrolase [Spirochaetes bacterium]|nr:HAD family hydrolase [Spirochaetota bacterium]